MHEHDVRRVAVAVVDVDRDGSMTVVVEPAGTLGWSADLAVWGWSLWTSSVASTDRRPSRLCDPATWVSENPADTSTPSGLPLWDRTIDEMRGWYDARGRHVQIVPWVCLPWVWIARAEREG
jgi:hypothetical protein